MIFQQRVLPIGVERNWQTGLLSENYIEPYIQRLLLPLRLLQYLIFPRYSIRYNFINSNDLTTNIKWGCYTILLVILHIKYTLLMFINSIRFNVLLSYNLLFIYSVYGICFLGNAIVVVVQSRINAELVINLQIIQSCLKTFKRQRDGIITNWIYSLLVVLFYVTYTSFQATVVVEPSFMSFLICCIIVLTPDLNVIYIVRVISLFRKQINIWESYLKFVAEFNERALDEVRREAIRNTMWKNLTKAYTAIADAYLICEKITAFPIIFYVILTFVQFLVYIQILITTANAKEVQIISLIWTTKNSLLLTLICRKCEYIYISMRNARIACRISLSEKEFSAADIEASRRLRRAVKEECLPFSARGLFTVNAVLPLQVLAIIVTYTVAILQFNFL